MKHGYKYTVYINGWVCSGDKYLFRIDIPEILQYIIARRWTLPKLKIKLDTLLMGYPDSFYAILKEPYERERFDNVVDALVTGLWQ